MTFRVILRKDVIYKNNTSPLCLLFFHDGRKKSVGLGISVARDYWDAEAQKVRDDCPDRDNIQFQITAKVKEYEKKIQRLEVIDIPVTFENLFEQNSKRLNCSIGEYLKQTIERLETLGKYGSASKHRSLLSRLSQFRSLNIRFDEIDLAYLHDFELFLRKEGNVNNSIATQYAILQCLYIRCHGGLCPLFRTPSESTQKLPDHVVRQLLNFNVVVLENPQQRTGKRGAHFGSVPHLFGMAVLV
uniref:phage integrase SAM-like domain and Arm DNA-binding domain-containing protein n=1 Tax=Alistipes shahii TaxID=328814 RepID=UPI003FEE99B0